jgi:cytochrome P450
MTGDQLSSKWETRLLPLDPVTVAHVLKNSTIYEKPPQSRRLLEGLIGYGMIATEGLDHKRQRRVATPAFSVQNMRALVPLVFNKGEELKDRWMGLIQEQAIDGSQKNPTGTRLDVCRWMSRATFDVIGLAGRFLSSLASSISLRRRSCRVVFRIRLPLQCHSKRRQRAV